MTLQKLLEEIKRLKKDCTDFLKLEGIKETVEAVTTHMEDSGEVLYKGSVWLQIKEELK